MKSVNSTNLASQLDASLTTDQSIDARKRPSSDLRLARVSRLETVLLLGPSLGARIVGCTISLHYEWIFQSHSIYQSTLSIPTIDRCAKISRMFVVMETISLLVEERKGTRHILSSPIRHSAGLQANSSIKVLSYTRSTSLSICCCCFFANP